METQCEQPPLQYHDALQEDENITDTMMEESREDTTPAVSSSKSDEPDQAAVSSDDDTNNDPPAVIRNNSSGSQIDVTTNTATTTGTVTRYGGKPFIPSRSSKNSNSNSTTVTNASNDDSNGNGNDEATLNDANNTTTITTTNTMNNVTNDTDIVANSNRNSSNINSSNTNTKPDIRIWLLQNQLTTLRDDVQEFQNNIKNSLQDFKDEWKNENDLFTSKVIRNESAWNTQFSHMTRHVQNVIADTKKYCRDELIKKQLIACEQSIMGKVTNEHLLPVQEQYRELETIVQYQSNELRDAIEKQQHIVTAIEKSMNVRKIIIEGLERQIQTFNKDLTSIQREWKMTSSSLDETSVKLADTVSTLSDQWKEQQVTLLKKINGHENTLYTWEMTMNLRYTEHERLYSQVQDQHGILSQLQQQLHELMTERDNAQREMVQLQKERDMGQEQLKVFVTCTLAKELESCKQELAVTRSAFKQYQMDKEQEQNELDIELDERQELFDQLQTTVEVQGQELQSIKTELASARVEREEVQKEIAKNMEMQNTLFDYLVKQVQNQANEIKVMNTALTNVQDQHSVALQDLDKKIETRKVLTDRLFQTVKQQTADMQQAKEDRDSIRALLTDHKDVVETNHRSVLDEFENHSKTRDIFFQKRDTEHEKLVNILSLRESQIDLFTKQMQEQDTEINEIKTTIVSDKQILDDTLKRSFHNVSNQLTAFDATHTKNYTTLLETTQTIHTNIDAMTIKMDAETKERTDTIASINTNIDRIQNEVINSVIMTQLENHTASIDQVTNDMIPSVRAEIATVQKGYETLTSNLETEIESRNTQFVQLVDQVQHQKEQIDVSNNERVNQKKEMDSVLDVRYVMFQHLVKQFQQHVDQLNEYKQTVENNNTNTDKRIVAAQSSINTVVTKLEEAIVDIQNKITASSENMKEQLELHTKLRECDKEEYMDSKKEIDKAFALRQTLFDQLVRQVQNHIAEFIKYKDEHGEMKRSLDVQFDNKSLHIDTIQEQITQLVEFIHTEKEERTVSESEIYTSIEKETSALRSEFNELIETKVQDKHDKTVKMVSDDFNVKSHEHNERIVSMISSKYDIEMSTLKEQMDVTFNQKLISSCNNVTTTIKSEMEEYINNNIVTKIDAHDTTIDDILKQVQDSTDAVFLLQEENKMKQEKRIELDVINDAKLLSLENSIATSNEELEKVKGVMNNHSTEIDALKEQVTSTVSQIQISSEEVLNQVRVDQQKNEEKIRADINETIVSHASNTKDSLDKYQKSLDSIQENIVEMSTRIDNDKDISAKDMQGIKDVLRTMPRQDADNVPSSSRGIDVLDEIASREINAKLMEHSRTIDSLTKNVGESKNDIIELQETINKEKDHHDSARKELENKVTDQYNEVQGAIEASKTELVSNIDAINGCVDAHAAMLDDIKKQIEVAREDVACVNERLDDDREQNEIARSVLDEKIASTAEIVDRHTHSAQQYDEQIENMNSLISSHSIWFEDLKKIVYEIQDSINEEKSGVNCVSTTSSNENMQVRSVNSISMRSPLYESSSSYTDLLKKVQTLESTIADLQKEVDKEKAVDRSVDSSTGSEHNPIVQHRSEGSSRVGDDHIEYLTHQIELHAAELQMVRTDISNAFDIRDEHIQDISMMLETRSAQVDNILEQFDRYEKLVGDASLSLSSTQKRDVRSEGFDDESSQLKSWKEMLDLNLSNMKVLEEKVQEQVDALKMTKEELVQKNHLLASEKDVLATTIEECNAHMKEFAIEAKERSDKLGGDIEELTRSMMEGQSQVKTTLEIELTANREKASHLEKLFDHLQKEMNDLKAFSAETSEKIDSVLPSILAKDEMNEFKGMFDERIVCLEGYVNDIRVHIEDTMTKIDTVASQKIVSELGEVRESTVIERTKYLQSEMMMKDFMNAITAQIEEIKAARDLHVAYLAEQNERDDAEKDMWTERLDQLEVLVHQLGQELRAASELREGVESELEEKNSKLRDVEKRLVETSEMLKETTWENRGLRVTLGGMQEQQEQYRKSFQKLHDDRLKGLLAKSSGPRSVISASGASIASSLNYISSVDSANSNDAGDDDTNTSAK